MPAVYDSNLNTASPPPGGDYWTPRARTVAAIREQEDRRRWQQLQKLLRQYGFGSGTEKAKFSQAYSSLASQQLNPAYLAGIATNAIRSREAATNREMGQQFAISGMNPAGAGAIASRNAMEGGAALGDAQRAAAIEAAQHNAGINTALLDATNQWQGAQTGRLAALMSAWAPSDFTADSYGLTGSGTPPSAFHR